MLIREKVLNLKKNYEEPVIDTKTPTEYFKEKLEEKK